LGLLGGLGLGEEILPSYFPQRPSKLFQAFKIIRMGSLKKGYFSG